MNLLPNLAEMNNTQKCDWFIEFCDRKMREIAVSENDEQFAASLRHEIETDPSLSIDYDARVRRYSLSKASNSASIAIQALKQVEPENALEAMLIDQMSALHNAGMMLFGQFYKKDDTPLDIHERFLNLANKLIKTYQQGYQAYTQGRIAGKQTIVVKHQNVQINGGQAVLTDSITQGEVK